MKHWIAPSILAADFAELGREVDDVIAAGADLVHFDVMDNHYVPNLSVGPMVLRALREYGITAPIDVHLMTRHVDRLIEEFAQAGANFISVHPEATEHPHRSLTLIRERGAKAGLALNPGTPLGVVEPLAELLDMVLVMSVNPGFGGQQFIRGSLERVRAVRELLNERDLGDVRIEVDGGIHAGNIGDVARAGADTFVAGSAIFGVPIVHEDRASDYREVISAMRNQLGG